MSVYLKEKDNIANLVFDFPGSKVNLLTSETIAMFNVHLDEISKDSSLKALIITSNKPNVFIAGADIKEIEGITDPSEGEKKAKAGQDVFNKLEDLNIPTIAVIDGLALGGGCELILACRYRIATFNEKIRIGLPEVNLGIVPGFGGTYRMPRCVGLSEGLKMVVSGKPIPVQKALKIGLVDRLYPQEGLERSVREFTEEVISLGHKGKLNRRKKRGLQSFLDNYKIGHFIVFMETNKSIMKLTKGFYPAPLKAVEVINESFYWDRDKALNFEAKSFSKLAVTDISKNLVKLFYASEKYRKLALPGAEDVKGTEVKKCGVIGAGVMGGGIAHLLSSKDIWARLKDVNYKALELGYQSADKIYREAMKKRRLQKSDAQRKFAHITATLDYSGFKDTDMVIEAVVENMDVKKKVFKELSAEVSGKAILCTNTSALSVAEMANQTNDPSRVIGLHFFNPVHRMPLVEVITTEQTSKETIVSTLNFVKKVGKTPILVKDSCGFLVNRVLLGYINEAGRILEEGASVTEIDNTMLKFGMPMGPFKLTDEVGIDVGYKVLDILHKGLGDRFEPVEIFKTVYDKGLLGKKAGKGFYVHKKQSTPNSEIKRLLKHSSTDAGNKQDWLNRMIFIMINESAMCLQEGIVEEPDAVDIGMVMGTGFPPFRGGLLRYADSVGINTIVEGLKLYRSRYGDDRFKPCEYLESLQRKNKTFYNQSLQGE